MTTNNIAVKYINEMKMPLGEMIHFLLKTIGQGPLQQTKASYFHSGERLVQVIKSSYLHKGSNKRGLRQRLLQVQAEDMAKECRKTSSSASQAFS
jgi:hypothetical protein